MNMTRIIWVAVCIVTAGVPLQLIGEEPDGALEQARIETFADALMDEEIQYIYARVGDIQRSGPEWKDIIEWYDAVRHPVTPLHLVISYPVKLPSLVYKFSGIGVSLPRPELDGPAFIIKPDSEWLVVLEPLRDDEWGELMERMTMIGTDHPLTPGNVIKVFRRSHGGICINEGWFSPTPGPNLKREQVYPVSVVQEVRRIHEVISSGGDTNALLALERELDVDFSRKLVQEIVRRKQPPPPPTQEEIWRAEIAALWRGGWKGAAERGKNVWEILGDYERQFRSAHEAGEMSDETFLEMMKLIRLDLEKNPNATHLDYRPPPLASPAPAQP